MRKELDKKTIVEEIIAAAESYKNQLVGKKFLYVFDNRYIEVIYKAANFRHLTGVATNLSAKEFYKLAVQRKLRSQQIYFSAAHPFRLCKKKVKHIGEIASLAGTESFLLEEITTQTQTYKFGTTELSFTLCFNKEFDVSGQEKNECYVVESLRDEDCFEKSKNVYAVTHIFSKENDVKKYNNILYIDKNNSLEELTEDIKAVLSEELFEKTSYDSAINTSKSEFAEGMGDTDTRLAVEAMIAGADQVARGIGEYYTYEDIFGKDVTEIKDNKDRI